MCRTLVSIILLVILLCLSSSLHTCHTIIQESWCTASVTRLLSGYLTQKQMWQQNRSGNVCGFSSPSRYLCLDHRTYNNVSASRVARATISTNISTPSLHSSLFSYLYVEFSHFHHLVYLLVMDLNSTFSFTDDELLHLFESFFGQSVNNSDQSALPTSTSTSPFTNSTNTVHAPPNLLEVPSELDDQRRAKTIPPPGVRYKPYNCHKYKARPQNGVPLPVITNKYTPRRLPLLPLPSASMTTTAISTALPVTALLTTGPPTAGPSNVMPIVKRSAFSALVPSATANNNATLDPDKSLPTRSVLELQNDHYSHSSSKREVSTVRAIFVWLTGYSRIQQAGCELCGGPATAFRNRRDKIRHMRSIKHKQNLTSIEVDRITAPDVDFQTRACVFRTLWKVVEAASSRCSCGEMCDLYSLSWDLSSNHMPML